MNIQTFQGANFVHIIILKGKEPAKELVLKLREAQTPILNCDLVEPLNIKMGSEALNMDASKEFSINQLNFNNVKLLNPTLARKNRQKALATWLIPLALLQG